jgi:peptide-methionine (R)-S-oxide reductase
MKILCALLALIGWSGEKVTHSEGDWLAILGEERFNVMRKKKTEHAFVGQYVHSTMPGVYYCAGCDLPLFLPQDKYDAGNGWPCFVQPAVSKNVYYLEDWTLPFKRYEVLCSRCEGHLGHVFHDGPAPKYLRYTINSIAIHLR